MGQRFLRVSFALFCLVLAVSAHATRYTINTTDDVVATDGDCSLREAIQAITDQDEVNECDAGTSSNTIVLQPGETYLLNGGEMVVGDGAAQVTVTLDVERPNAFDSVIRENAVVVASANSRVFRGLANSFIALKNVTLQGGSGQVVGNGGLILSEGSVGGGVGAVFEGGNVSGDGGAVYLTGTSTVVSVDLTRFTGNTALGNGGAIATDSAFIGDIEASNSYFDGNSAGGSGGAIHGDADAPPSGPGLVVRLQNVTFYDNDAFDGGAIFFAALQRFTELNNVTVAGNDAGANAALAYGDHDPDPAEDRDEIRNSVIVGNTGPDCSFTEDFAFLAYVVSNGCGAAAGGLDEERPLFSSDSADFSVLLGEDGNVCSDTSSGASDCVPRSDLDRGFAGFLPNSLATGPAAYNAGSPEAAVDNACSSQDQRGADRADRCDAGAVEFQISRAIIDEVEVIQGRSTVVDVLANDLGDNIVDCRLANASITVPATDLPVGVAPLSDCVSLPIPPRRGDVLVDLDDNGYPTLRFRSSAGFHGLDNMRYSIARSAVSGATFADGPLSAQVNLIIEPASGFTESENIDDLGGALPLWTLLLAVVAASRRSLRRLVAIACMLAASSVNAAEITVNTLLDTISYGDDLCSIREALDNSIDGTPIFSPDCAPGATGRDTILLPSGTLTLNSPLLIDNTTVDIEGQGVDDTIIAGPGNSRLITAGSGVTLRYLTLQGGRTTNRGGAINTTATLVLEWVRVTDNQADGDGGAIFLNFNSDETRDVVFNSVLFDTNVSNTGDGGAVGMFGQFQEHDIGISGSTFSANTAMSGVGGAMDVNLQRGGSLNIANSTFTGNDAGSGGSALDLQDSVAPVALMNTTIANHASGTATGAIDIGNSTANVRMSNSIYSDAGGCSSGTGRFSNNTLNNIFSAPRDATCQFSGEVLPPDPDPSNAEASSANIQAVLGGATPVAASGLTSDYVPPHFAIDASQSGNVAYPLMVDAGADGDFRPGFTGPANCRLVDLRGESREAGPGCDLGAFELQVATAAPDSGRNRPRLDRNAIIDVLVNDLPGEGTEILTGSIELLSGPPLGTASVVLRSDETVPCSGTDLEEDCVVFYESPPLTCADFEDDPFVESFTYRFAYSSAPPAVDGYSVSGAENPGDDLIQVSIQNVPPQIQGQTRYTERGVPVVFSLNVTDPDGVNPPTNYTVSREPLFAKTRVIEQPAPDEDIVTAEGIGLVINEEAGTVTYYPADISKAFNDSFAIEVEDECGTTAAASFFVRYAEEDASGGELLGSGGNYPLAAILFSLVAGMRRRFALS